MTKEEAIKLLLESKDNDIKRSLREWEEWDERFFEAIDIAIEALENYDKLAEDLQTCLEMYKKKRAEVKAFQEPEIIHCKDCIYYHPSYCEIWSKFGTVQTPQKGFCYKAVLVIGKEKR